MHADTENENGISKVTISRRNYAEVRSKIAKRAKSRIPANDGFGPSAREPLKLGQSHGAQKLRRVSEAFKTAIHESKLVHTSLRQLNELQEECNMLRTEDRFALLLKGEASRLSQDVRELHQEIQEQCRVTYAERLASFDRSEICRKTLSAKSDTKISSSQKRMIGQTSSSQKRMIVQTSELLAGIQRLQGALDPQALARHYQEALDIQETMKALHLSVSSDTEILSEDAIRAKAEEIERVENQLFTLFACLSGSAMTKATQHEDKLEHRILKSDIGPDPYHPPSLEWSKWSKVVYANHDVTVGYPEHDVIRNKKATINAIRSTMGLSNMGLSKKPRPQRSKIFKEAGEKEEKVSQIEASRKSEVDGSHRSTIKQLQPEYVEHYEYNADENRSTSPRVSINLAEGEVGEVGEPDTTKSLSLSRPRTAPDQTDTHETQVSLRSSIGQEPDLPDVSWKASPALRKVLPSRALPRLKTGKVYADLPMHGPPSPKTPNRLKRTPRIDPRTKTESPPGHKANRTYSYVRASTYGSPSPRPETADNSFRYYINMDLARQDFHSAGPMWQSGSGDCSPSRSLDMQSPQVDDIFGPVSNYMADLTGESCKEGVHIQLRSGLEQHYVESSRAEIEAQLAADKRPETVAAPIRSAILGLDEATHAEGRDGDQTDSMQSPRPLTSGQSAGRLRFGRQAFHRTKPTRYTRWSNLMRGHNKFLSDVVGGEAKCRNLYGDAEDLGGQSDKDPGLHQDIQEEAWSEPVHCVSNYEHSFALLLGRPLLPDDKLRTKDGKGTTYAELKSLTRQKLQASFPLQVQLVTEGHVIRTSRFPWLSEPRSLQGLLREQDTRMTIEHILFERKRCGMRELCVSQDMATEWENFCDLVGAPEKWRCTCCHCAECLDLEVSTPTSPVAVAVRVAAGLPVSPELLEQQSETRARTA